MLPKEFHKWKFIYYYYRKWVSLEEFDLLLEHLCGYVCVKRGQTYSTMASQGEGVGEEGALHP